MNVSQLHLLLGLRAAAGQMGAMRRIVSLCPLPQILWTFEIKKNTYYRGQNRPLLKYNNKYINCITYK